MKNKEEILVTQKQLDWYVKTYPSEVYKANYFQGTLLVTKLSNEQTKRADFRMLPFEHWSKSHNKIFEGNAVAR